MAFGAEPLSRLFVSIGADVSSVDRALGQVERGMEAAAGKSEKSGGRISGALQGIGNALAKLGLASMGLGAVKGALEGLGEAVGIGAASDLAESMSKAEVVFGSAADSIKAFGSTAAQNLGVSKRAAIEAAGTFGNLFVSMGLGQGDAANLSKGILTLGSDLASFNNLKPEEVLEKLRAGLVGESEPLRTLGINLNAAMVEERAMKMGLVDLNGEVTEAGKVQARYALIMEQSKTAQGDFARTSTGLANAQRIISASFDDLKTSLGTRLLPVVARVSSWFAQGLPGAMRALEPTFDAVGRAVEGLGGVFERVGGAVGAFLSYLRPGNQVDLMRQWFGDFGPKIDAFVLSLKQAGEVVGYFLQNLASGDWDMIRELGSEWLGVDLAAPFDALSAAWQGLAPTGERIGALFGAVRDAIAGLFPDPLQSLIGSFGGMASEVSAGLDPLGAMVGAINAVSGAIAGVVDWLGQHKEVQAVLVGLLTAAAMAYALATAAAIAHGVVTKGAAVATGAMTAAQMLLNLALTANPVGLVIVAIAGLAAGLIYAYNTSEEFRNVVDRVFAFLKSFVTSATAAAGLAVNAFLTTVQTLGTGVGDTIDDIVGFFQGLPGRLQALLASIGDTAAMIGNAIRDGIVGGIEGTIGVIGDLGDALLGALKSLINSAISAINDAIPNDLGFEVLGNRVTVDLPDNPIPMLAKGTSNFQGGLAIVGERGPELVQMPKGSKIFPTEEIESTTPALAGAGAGVGINLVQNFYISNDMDVEAVAYRVVQKIQEMRR